MFLPAESVGYWEAETLPFPSAGPTRLAFSLGYSVMAAGLFGTEISLSGDKAAWPFAWGRLWSVQ